MRISVAGVFLTGVLCCFAIPDGEKVKGEGKISSHHEQQLGYHHHIHDANQREQRTFKQHQSPKFQRQQPENYSHTQDHLQQSREQKESKVQEELKQDSNQNPKQLGHLYRQENSEHIPQLYHQHHHSQQQQQQHHHHHTQHHQQSQQRKQFHRRLPPPSPSPHRRRNRPRQSPDRNVDNGQQTKAFGTKANNGEAHRSGESDSFERNGSRPISAEDIFQRLPHRYEVNNQHNVKNFHNNEGSSPHQDHRFKEPYVLSDSSETTGVDISEIPEKERPVSADQPYREPYFFENDYPDESLFREGSVSVYAYTESSVQPISSSTVSYPEPTLFVDAKTNRFGSNQPDIAPNVGHAYLRRQVEDIARKRNTTSVQNREDSEITEDEIDYDFQNNQFVEQKRKGEDIPQPVYHSKVEFDEYPDVFEDIPDNSDADETSQIFDVDSGHRTDTSHPGSIPETNNGRPASLSGSSEDLGRRSRSRHQSGLRRFQRPQQNSHSSDQRARNKKPQISMSKQLARYSDTHLIVSPLFNSTFNRNKLLANNSEDLPFTELIKSQPAVKTRPSFHIKPDSILDFASVDNTRGNPSDRIVEEIVEYSQSSEGPDLGQELEEGFAGPENLPDRKYSYSYVNHYIAPTPKVVRTTKRPVLASNEDVQVTSPRSYVDAVVIAPPAEDIVYQKPEETVEDSVVGEYSDLFSTVVKDSGLPEVTTHIETESTTISSTSSPSTTTTTTSTTPTAPTTTPETTTATPTTTTLSAASISPEQNNPFSYLVDRESGSIISSTESPMAHTTLTSPLPTSVSHETTTPVASTFVHPENLLRQLPPNPYPNLTGLSTNLSSTNWNPARGIQADFNSQNPFLLRGPISQSFQSNTQSQSSPLGSSGSGLFGLSNLLGLGTLSGLQGFGQSSPAQPGTANLGFTSAPTLQFGSTGNAKSGQQGGNVPDLGGLGYLSLLTTGLGGLNLSPQSGFGLSSLPSLGSGGEQQIQAFSNPFQHNAPASSSSQPDNSLVQLFLRQLGGGGGSSGIQNPLGFPSSVGQNPYAIHPQALTLGSVSAPLVPAPHATGSVPPPAVAPAAAQAPAAGSNSGSDSVVPEGK